MSKRATRKRSLLPKDSMEAMQKTHRAALRASLRREKEIRTLSKAVMRARHASDKALRELGTFALAQVGGVQAPLIDTAKG